MNKLKLCLILLLVFACTYSPRYNSSSSSNTKNKKHSNNKKIDFSKYKVDFKKKRYIGISSWYGPNFDGKLTANGETFDQWGLTAAHKTLPLNTIVRVTNLDNNKTLILRINDRGPYVGDRVLDCSLGAAKKLGFKGQGTANVQVDVIEFGDNKYTHRD